MLRPIFAHVLLAMTALSATAGVSQAAVIFADPGNSGFLRDDYTAVGYKFTVGATPLFVSKVGVWDDDQDGLAYNIPVVLYDVTAATQQVYNVTVLGSTLIGEFRYVSITPITLLANRDYVVQAGYVNNGGERWHNAGSYPLATALVSGLDARYGGGGAGASAGPGAFIGPNLLFTVPEPASLSLLSIGALALCRRRRA